ncbi:MULTISPECIES: LysR family transcriptional regulator [unclassified Ruegeria]|uniref:LysR family transcriptional regulator n=1 Tax=unclassified Ruegeria TaxID=2625375 RepID=UPI001489143B|nr:MULTISPECIES: LysR family transcriptional regulator [unclassified Ruegeria]
MQPHDWNDLKYALALFRTGKLREASRLLGVSETTVSRRIKALELSLGTSLFLRSPQGRYEPTDSALAILPRAEAIERENLALSESIGQKPHQIVGQVRVSSVPLIVNRFLVPKLRPFLQTHPLLTVELVPTSENLDLSKREADLAVRLRRPSSGGLRTKAQKLGALTFGVYAASSYPAEHADTQCWITYDDVHAELPQARWLEDFVRGLERKRSNLRVADAETALEAVANGLGTSLLPDAVAAHDPRLKRLSGDKLTNLPTREVWLLSHIDQSSRRSVVAVKEWLANLPWV